MFDRMHGVIMTPPKYVLVTYSGHKIRSDGEVTIKVRGQPIQFQVEHGQPILGKQACVTLQLISRVDELSNESNYKQDDIRANAMTLVSKYDDVFSGL